jgi:hypothetical protein
MAGTILLCDMNPHVQGLAMVGLRIRCRVANGQSPFNGVAQGAVLGAGADQTLFLVLVVDAIPPNCAVRCWGSVGNASRLRPAAQTPLH